MKRKICVLICSVILILTNFAFSQNNPPVIDTVKVAQQDESFLVDIYYDVSDSDDDSLVIYIHISEDSGKTYTVPANTLSGDFGYRIYPGLDRHIIWDAGTDYPEQFGEAFQVKLTASDADLNHTAAIPTGSFAMGDSAGFDDPRHEVELNEYGVSLYTVTNEEYRIFCEMTGHEYPPEGEQFQAPSGYFLNNNRHPVIDVSWYDAVMYCNWLSTLLGLEPCYDTNDWSFDETKNGFHLPTEAQWERSARGNLEKMTYPWGNDHPPGTRANYNDYAGDLVAIMADLDGEGRGTIPSDTLTTNAFGLYQMAGNVWEWCNDWYSEDYYYNSPATDPLGPDTGSEKVIRGGAWNTSDIYLHCAIRDKQTPDKKRYDIGFRVAR